MSCLAHAGGVGVSSPYLWACGHVVVQRQALSTTRVHAGAHMLGWQHCHTTPAVVINVGARGQPALVWQSHHIFQDAPCILRHCDAAQLLMELLPCSFQGLCLCVRHGTAADLQC
jgi:hypothetical protein